MTAPESPPDPSGTKFTRHRGRCLLVSTHEPMIEALRSILPETVELEVVSDWSEGEPELVEASYDAVCLDYEAIKIEGVDSFIHLDNILKKEDSTGVLVLREPSSRGHELYETLETFESLLGPDEETLDRDHLRRAVLEPLAPPDPPEAEEHSSEAHTPSRSRASDESGADESREPGRTIRIPVVEEGRLRDRPLLELLHHLHLRESTGRLTLEHDAIERRYLLDDGELVSSSRTDVSDPETLESAFAWEGGQYRFEPRSSVRGRVGTLEPYMIRGVTNHLPRRTALDALVETMEHTPVYTDRWERVRDRLGSHDLLEQLVEACTGDETLESILSTLGSDAREGFQVAYFALSTDVIALLESDPPSPPLRITYEYETRESSSPVGSEDHDGESSQSGAQPSTGEEAEKELSTDDIREAYRTVQEGDAYEIFDLWEGCGDEEVRNRFYELVKQYHPDTYGRDLPDRLDEIVQETFVGIQEAKSKLLELEDEQLVSPDQAEASVLEFESSSAGIGDEVSSVIASDAEELGSDARSKTISPGNDASRSNSGGTSRDRDQRGRHSSVGSGRPESTGARDERTTTRPRSRTDSTSSSTSGGVESVLDSSSSGASTPGTDSSSTAETSSAAVDSSPTSGDSASNASRTTNPNGSASNDSSLDSKSDGSTGEVEIGETLNTEETRGQKLDKIRSRQASPEVVSEVSGAAEDEDEAQELFNRGYRAYKNDDEERAFDYVSRAHDFESDNALYKTFYGYLLFLNEPERKDEAQSLLEEAIEIGDEQVLPDAHLFLGRVFRVEEKHNQARRHFERSVRLNPSSVEAQRELRFYELRDEGGDLDTESIVEEAKRGEQPTHSDGSSEEEEEKDGPSFQDDPVEFIKEILNKDINDFF